MVDVVEEQRKRIKTLEKLVINTTKQVSNLLDITKTLAQQNAELSELLAQQLRQDDAPEPNVLVTLGTLEDRAGNEWDYEEKQTERDLRALGVCPETGDSLSEPEK